MNRITKAVLNITQGLADVNRYSQVSLIKDESVLEHIGFCNMASYLIGKHMIADGEELDLGTIMLKCTVHDIEEFMVGDIPRPTKYHNEETKYSIDMAAQACVRDLHNYLPRIFLFADWIQAKDQSKEGFFVQCIDMAAVICKAHSEVFIKSNKSMIWHCKSNLDGLKELIKWSDEIFTESKIMQEFLSDLAIVARMAIDETPNCQIDSRIQSKV